MATLIEGVVRSILVDTAAVSDLVGNRVYWNKTPQVPTVPCIVFRAVDDPHRPLYMSADGSKAKSGQRMFEFTCMSGNSTDGLNLVDQMVDTLRWAQGTTYGFTIETIFLNDVRKTYNPETDLWVNYIDATVEYFEA